MLMEGIRLMVVGMSTVFAFLGLLVAAMHVQAVVVARWLPERRKPDDAELAAVLAAVAARHGRT